LLLEEHGDELQLLDHLDANNPHCAVLTQGAPVFFQLLGPDAYASPDLYPDPQLPGWLYLSVQGDARVESVLNEAALRDLLEASTRPLGAANQDFTLEPTDAHIDRFIGGVHSFRLQVTRISGVAKLAKDKGRRDAQLAHEYLSERTSPDGKTLLERLMSATPM
jgi:transcriptional regulator